MIRPTFDLGGLGWRGFTGDLALGRLMMRPTYINVEVLIAASDSLLQPAQQGYDGVIRFEPLLTRTD